MSALVLANAPRITLAGPIAPDWRSSPLQVMMATAPGCSFCAAWKAEIGPGYAASAEGRAAPIFEVDITGPYPDGLVIDRRVWVTPSFLVLDRGIERGRIEGYVGKARFHPILADLLSRIAQETRNADQAGVRFAP